MIYYCVGIVVMHIHREGYGTRTPVVLPIILVMYYGRVGIRRYIFGIVVMPGSVSPPMWGEGGCEFHSGLNERPLAAACWICDVVPDVKVWFLWKGAPRVRVVQRLGWEQGLGLARPDIGTATHGTSWNIQPKAHLRMK
jgi:hypothetical protein